jgi:gamma-carbonic anhydrase
MASLPVSFGICHAKHWLIGHALSGRPSRIANNAAEIAPTATIWSACVLRGDAAQFPIRIGARVKLRDGTVVHSCWGRGAIIGDDVSIGHKALMHACTLDSGSFVGGVSAVVTDHVVVLYRAMVAAGALVTPDQRIPEGQL